MLKQISVIFIIANLCGCVSSRSVTYDQATALQEKIVVIKPRISQGQYHLLSGNDPILEKSFNRYIKTGHAANIITDGFVKFAYNHGQQPIIMTHPLQETIVSLEPGEHFTNVTTGDPNRWSYSAAISGANALQQVNILVKPSMSNIATNMVITTDKRIYNLKLISGNGQLTRQVRFWYPDEMVATLNQDIIKQADNSTITDVPDVNLKRLSFNYRIKADGLFHSLPSWSPIRVFDDGVHTYIEFPRSMENRDMPVLFIQNHGNQELVNYRSKTPYFVVDKIFKDAVLVIGVGQSQTKVFLTNQNYV